MDELMTLGVVLFDNPEGGGQGSGWASIEGADPFRIDGIQSLRSDVRWWTNLTYDSIFEQRGFRESTIKGEGYLRSKMDHIVQELGLAAHRPVEVAPYLSYLFKNVMQGAHQFYGLNPKRLGGEKTLTKDFADAMRLNLVMDKPDYAVTNSYLNMNKCDGRWESDVIYTWIRRQRLEHAIDVLSAPVPRHQAKWSSINDKSRLKNNSAAVDFLLKFPHPILAKVSVSNISPDVADLIGFGNTNSRYDKYIREWLSHPELLWLSRYADIQVMDAMYADSYQPAFLSHERVLKDALMAPKLDRGVNDLSISMGLLAENYWVALANKVEVKTGNKTRSVPSPQAAWLRSVDRLHCFLTALKIRNLVDITFMGYSVGCLNVSFPIQEWEDVQYAVGKVGAFMPPEPPQKHK